MSNSLQDQLLRAGVIDEKRVKQATKGKKVVKQKRKKGTPAPPPPPVVAAAQVERDRELNRQQQRQREERALEAQIRQLISSNRVAACEGEIGYHFVVANKVKRLDLTPECHQRLSRGRLAIALLDEEFVLVSREVGEKIQQRNPERVVLVDPDASRKAAEKSAEEDPYAAYPVPDDLMW